MTIPEEGLGLRVLLNDRHDREVAVIVPAPGDGELDSLIGRGVSCDVIREGWMLRGRWERWRKEGKKREWRREWMNGWIDGG